MRKILMSESRKSDLEKQIAEVLNRKGALEEEMSELDAQLAEVDRKYKEQRQANEEAHSEEIATLKRANQQVKVRAGQCCRMKVIYHNLDLTLHFKLSATT